MPATTSTSSPLGYRTTRTRIGTSPGCASCSPLTPHSRGFYVNFTSDDSSQRVREAAYGPQKWRRLVALKNDYDPDNIFRFNANISRE